MGTYCYFIYLLIYIVGKKIIIIILKKVCDVNAKCVKIFEKTLIFYFVQQA